jgi:hypothetical protein
MCIRCGDHEAPGPLGFCSACVVQARVEATRGFRRLTEYLAAWAAFDEWCRSSGTTPS